MSREREPMLVFTTMASPTSDSIEMYASVCHRCKYEDDDCATILCPICSRPTVWEPTSRPRDFFDRRTAVWVPDPSSLRAEGSGQRRLPLPPPGEANALGRIRFNFPNRFLVYQHDTPDKYMFAHETRAYSHGCMRVQDPAKYAEVLFNIARPSEGWTAERVKRMFGGAEQDIQLPEKIWVHLTYQSAFVDETGKLHTRRDVYGLDSRTLAAIKSERGTIEPAEERRREIASSGGGYRRPVMQPQRSFSSFFEALFGGPGPGPAPTPPRRIAR